MTQEQIVDNIILNELENKFPGSKEKILSKTNKESRRVAILSIMDDDRRLFEQYKNVIKSENYCSHYAEDTVQILRNYIKVADTEVKEHGEVMTPITLVEEMLDKIPNEVWSNPNLKWLDPCNGVGTFPSIVVKRLMDGLKDIIEDECERYRHIIENMIYVCEIQSKNMFLFHCAFDREDDYELNTYYGSFLENEFEKHMTKVWGLNGFDIIIGNPPYNRPGTSNSGNTIWPKFVDKMVSLLSDNGYMCVVHPSLWRRPQHKTWNLLTQFQITHLDIHDTQDGLRVFGAGTRYDWYVLNKTPIHSNTNVRFEDGVEMEINFSGRNFLPNKNVLNIDTFTNGDELCRIIHSRSDYAVDKSWVGKEQNDEYQYPLINSIHSNGDVIYRYSSINTNGHFGIPKIIISDSTSQIYNDFEGQYGLTSHCMGICVDEVNEGFLIEKALKSFKFQQVTDSIKWSNYWVDPRFFKYLNRDFYRHFVDEEGNEI